MSKKIKFIYTSEYAWNTVERVRPASSYIPEWHRKLPSYLGGELKLSNRISNATPKKCVPMLDSIRSGYIVPLWSDILIEENDDDQINISWRVSKDVFQSHGDLSDMIPSPDEYYPIAFKYVSYLTVETPRGYSILITPPMGHYDLPFMPISAVVDSDRPTVDLAFPLWIKRGSAGIVERGTPVVQITPFKRENWKSEFDYISENRFEQQLDKYFNATIKNNYFKNTWSKKEYR